MSKKVVLSLPYASSMFGPVERSLVEAEVIWEGKKTIRVKYTWKPFPDLEAAEVERLLLKDDDHIVEIVER